MGFLNPLLLLAAAAIGVPLLLHLFHRHESRRIPFPALRYLLRTEREHARRIKLRQLLLLLLRVAVVLMLATAAARPFLRRGGGAHPATALAIVLDNSMSAGRVIQGERVMDRIKRAAFATLDEAGGDDRIWVLRAGEPWDVSTPGNAAHARGRVAATEVSAAAADLTRTVRRGAGLVLQAGLPAAEVHLLSDLQATALGEPPPDPLSEAPVLVYRCTDDERPTNRYLGAVLVGGGLPPIAGRRSELAVGLGGDTLDAPLRLIVNDRIRGATRVVAGTTTLLPFGPFAEGWVSGYVETDPDDLSGDDRRWFALAVRPPPVVELARGGERSYFLEQAVAVLVDAGRLRSGGTAANPVADVVLAVGGVGVGAVRSGSLVAVVPPSDPVLLPAVNRRLVEAGIPWRYLATDARGEARIGEHRLPVPLDDVSVVGSYRLEGTLSGADVVARLTDGSPWLVSGTAGNGSYRLVGSPLDPDATSLPVSAFMIPLLEWLVSPLGGEGGLSTVTAGGGLALPGSATAVQTPDGVIHPVDGAQDFRPTSAVGIYRVLAGDSVLALVAVNPPVRESLLAPADPAAVAQALGPDATVIDDLQIWRESIFTRRQGRELWQPLLIAVLILLVVESWVAATGRGRGERSGERGGGLRTGVKPRARAHTG